MHLQPGRRGAGQGQQGGPNPPTAELPTQGSPPGLGLASQQEGWAEEGRRPHWGERQEGEAGRSERKSTATEPVRH